MLIERARADDLGEVLRLLSDQHLPVDDVEHHIGTMVVARDAERVVGVAALELYAGGALLRSVAVDSAARGKRLGHQLTEAALSVARENGIGAVFLLTTTAEHFFPRFGFERIARAEVPASVQASVEFQVACPASAVVMRKRLSHPMKTVLFACVHNAGRSQMAAAWFNLLADPAKAHAISAGTEPRTHVHPEVVTAMMEVGVDLSAAPTTKLSDEVAQQAQWLVTMGCGDQCPAVPGAAREEWACEDPKGKPIEQVRVIRDGIRDRVRAFVEGEGWSRH
jgi:arsenate reductase